MRCRSSSFDADAGRLASERALAGAADRWSTVEGKRLGKDLIRPSSAAALRQRGCSAGGDETTGIRSLIGFLEGSPQHINSRMARPGNGNDLDDLLDEFEKIATVPGQRSGLAPSKPSASVVAPA
jgi:hypothetical protein